MSNAYYFHKPDHVRIDDETVSHSFACLQLRDKNLNTVDVFLDEEGFEALKSACNSFHPARRIAA